MLIYSRYIFTQLGWITLALTFILSCVIWLTQSLRYVDLVIAKGLPLSIFFKLTILLVPSLISTVLPISFFMAMLYVFSRLYNDSELVVLRVLGLSNLQILNPCFKVAGLVATILYIMNLYVHPFTTQKFKDYKDQIRNTISSYMIHAGDFITLKQMTFYVKEKSRSGVMRGIFMHDMSNPRNPITILAEKGLLYETGQGLRLILFNGSRQSIEPKTGGPSYLSFEQYNLEVHPKQESVERTRKPSELFLGDLLRADDSVSDKLRHKLLIEAHQRLLLPLTIFPFLILSAFIFLYGDYERRGRTRKIIAVVIVSIVLEAILMLLLNLAAKSPLFPSLAYALVVLIVIGGIALLADRTPPPISKNEAP